MEVKVKKNIEKSEAELEITASSAEFAPYVAAAAKKLSQERTIKGFRPGKAPVDVAVEVFGRERLYNEALERAVPRFFVTAVLDNDLEVISRPSVVIKEAGEAGLNFTATASILPQVTLGAPQAIEAKKKEVSVSDEDADKEIQHIARMRAEYIEVARAAEKGDVLNVDYKITADGVAVEGGEAKAQRVNLGEGYYMAEFEEHLEGASAGDIREFKVSLPKTGKEAQAWVKVLNVQKRVLPEINDEFAKKLGKFSSVSDLKDKLKANIKDERGRREQDRFRGEIADKLAENSTFKTIPAVLIDKEIDRLLDEFKSMLAWQNKTLEMYLQEKNRTLAAVREEMRANAEKSVKTGLALRAFADQEGITADEKEAEEKAQEYLRQFPSAKEARQRVDPGELKEHLMYTLRNQKALEKLEEKIKKAK